MNNLEKWLNEEAAPLIGAAKNVPPSLGPINVEGLRESLRSRIAQNESYFRIAFALAALLALATLVAAFLPDTNGNPWVAGAFGISTAGSVAMVMNAVRDKNAFEMMLELALGLDEEAMRDVLRVLIFKYKGNKRPITTGGDND